MILLLYAAILMKKQWWNVWTGLTGYLICLLAILWNTVNRRDSCRGMDGAFCFPVSYRGRMADRSSDPNRTGTRGLCGCIIFRSLWNRESL